MTPQALETRLARGVAGSSTEPRVPALDGVRGLAITLVLINNIYPPTHASLPGAGGFVWHLSNLGWVGVDLFFVLSGFLITGILSDTKNGAHYLRNFYGRRIVRIFPLFYGSLFAVYFIIPHLLPHPADAIAQLHRLQWFEWLYMGNFGYYLRGYPPFPTVHFWSLAVEEQFYFIWPFIVLLVRRDRLVKLCAVLIACSVGLCGLWVLTGQDPKALYLLTPFRAQGLLLGAMMALTLRGPGGAAALARWLKPAALACAGPALALMIWTELSRSDLASAAVGSVGFPLIVFALGGLMLAALDAPPGSRTHRFFTSRTMRFMGRYSYAMYILHEFVLWGFNTAAPWTLAPPEVMGSRVPLGIVVLVGVTGVTIALSLLSWHLYEKQFLKLKRYFPYAREVRQDTGMAPDVATAAIR